MLIPIAWMSPEGSNCDISKAHLYSNMHSEFRTSGQVGLTAYPRASDCINTIIKVPTVWARMRDAQYNTSDVAGVAYRTSAANTMYTTQMQIYKQFISNRFT